jgi:hypothetical protein
MHDLSEEVIRREIDSAFAMWQAAANINFRAAEASLTADILIGAEVEPAGWAFANVSYEAGSEDRLKRISQSLICLNPLKRWKVGFDGDLKSYDLRYAIAHEIGHAIGLDHPATGGHIMGVSLRGTIPRPSARRHRRRGATLRPASGRNGYCPCRPTS